MSGSTEIKKLYKSRTDRMIDGVCGGFAKYFNVDSTLVRIAWVLLTLLGGSGILFYLVAMIVMKKEPYSYPPPPDAQHPGAGTGRAETASKKNNLFWGLLLIIVGSVLFLDNVGWSFWHSWRWFHSDFFLPLVLILVGVGFLWGGRNSLTKEAAPTQDASTPLESQPASSDEVPRRLYRSFNDSKLFGVCGGLGSYFGIDSTIVRLLFVLGAFASAGVVLLGYLILAIVVPKERPLFNPA